MDFLILERGPLTSTTVPKSSTVKKDSAAENHPKTIAEISEKIEVLFRTHPETERDITHSFQDCVHY